MIGIVAVEAMHLILQQVRAVSFTFKGGVLHEHFICSSRG